jgi:hypothetical protein
MLELTVRSPSHADNIMADALPTPSLDDWQVLEIELRGFPVEPDPSIAQSWWQDITGGEDVTSVKRRLEVIDRGAFQGRDFMLHIDPLRIIWKADWLPDPNQSRPFIGQFNEVESWMTGLMEPWLRDSAPALKRLGFAAKVLLPTENREGSYAQLSRLLQSVDVDPSALELMYRINRPRTSNVGVPALVINRLATWASVQIKMQLRVRTGSQEVSTQFGAETIYGCQLSLDVNTSEDRTEPLPSEYLPSIWNELVSAGAEIIDRGDVQ